MIYVAPHAGARIETEEDEREFDENKVAPHAGAWIETEEPAKVVQCMASLPMRERGLKPPYTNINATTDPVAPHAGAWIETLISGSPSSNSWRRSPCGSVD